MNHQPKHRNLSPRRGGILALLAGAALALGAMAGCSKPDVNQGKIFQNDPGPGMEVDPALIKWTRADSWDIAMEGANNLRILPGGGVVVIGAGGFEALELPGYGTPPALPRTDELRSDLLRTEDGGFVTSSRQDLIHHTSADDLEGNILFSPGGNAYITNLALDADGNILIADMGNRLFWKVSPDGQLLAKWGNKNPDLNQPGLVIPSPYLDVTLDEEGRVWGVNPGRQSIYLYDEDHAVVRSWGFASARTEGFCGCCNPTHLVALPGGTFLTSEKGLPRVKEYSNEGELVGVVAPPTDFDPDGDAIVMAAPDADEVLILDPSDQKLWRYTRNSN